MSALDTLSQIDVRRDAVSGLRILYDKMRSDFLVPRKIPDERQFADIIALFHLLGTTKEVIASKLGINPDTVAEWMSGTTCPEYGERLGIVAAACALVHENGICYGGNHFSATTGVELVKK